MRFSRALCIALGALNLALFFVASAPKADEALRARVRPTTRAADHDRARGTVIIFRPAGEYPAPAPSLEQTQLPVATPEQPVDDVSIAFLGSMTATNGVVKFFFKNKLTNRVYSGGGEDGDVAILSASEKEFILEIDGKKYRVACK